MDKVLVGAGCAIMAVAVVLVMGWKCSDLGALGTWCTANNPPTVTKVK